jgi:hypothetical protein
MEKYSTFVDIYNKASNDARENKITNREALRIQYDANAKYDNEYWNFDEKILKLNIELQTAYENRVIGICHQGQLQLEINKKQDMLKPANKWPTVKAKPQPNSTLNNIGNGYVASAQARVNAVNLATTAVSTTARAVANVATAVGNAYIQGSNDMANTRRMEAQATQQLVSNVATTVVNNAPQVIRETAQGVSSVGFEVATQVASGLHTTNLMISGANEALSSINNREKGVVETTGEAVATGVATYVGGQVGSVIATGLLVKTAIETNMNVVGNIIQEEINRHQQGGV